jgi:hypothetical protein
MSWKIRRDDERYYVTMDDALKAGDGVILNVQAARIKELEDQNKELLKALENLERTAGVPAVSDDPARVAARAAIAKARGVATCNESLQVGAEKCSEAREVSAENCPEGAAVPGNRSLEEGVE